MITAIPYTNTSPPSLLQTVLISNLLFPKSLITSISPTTA